MQYLQTFQSMLQRPKLTTRCRADPLVTLSSMFETILNEMRILPNVSASSELSHWLSLVLCIENSIEHMAVSFSVLNAN